MLAVAADGAELTRGVLGGAGGVGRADTAIGGGGEAD